MPSQQYTRRKRRIDRQVLAHGKKAKRKHARVGGRTGQVHHKRLAAGPSRGASCSSTAGHPLPWMPTVRVLLR